MVHTDSYSVFDWVVFCLNSLVAASSVSSLGRWSFRLRKRRARYQLDQERMAEINATTLFQLRMFIVYMFETIRDGERILEASGRGLF